MFNALIYVKNANDNEVTFGAKCMFCGEEHFRTFKNTLALMEGWEKFRSGVLVQNAFPAFSPSDREFFITGDCPKLFG